MMEENLFLSNYADNCDVGLIGNKYFSFQTGFALQKDSPLTDIFNHQ